MLAWGLKKSLISILIQTATTRLVRASFLSYWCPLYKQASIKPSNMERTKKKLDIFAATGTSILYYDAKLCEHMQVQCPDLIRISLWLIVVRTRACKIVATTPSSSGWFKPVVCFLRGNLGWP
jgi:hypothetical protein